MSLSNNKRKEPLHVVDPVDPKKRPNDYMKAIRAVCKVVGRYDKDQMFPVYGFGAAPNKTDGKISQCFPLSLNKDEVEIQGADNIVQAYLDCLQVIQMKEPTHMGPVIREVMQEQCDDDESSGGSASTSYQLLILITDGQVDDMTETVDAIVDASSLPMSILIVGIGDVNAMGLKTFDKMDQLDESQLRSVITGRVSQRDVVNFIAFDSYKNTSANDFARGALAEVPRHFLSWVQMSGFKIETMPVEEKAETETPAAPIKERELDPHEVDLFRPLPKASTSGSNNDPDAATAFSDNEVTSENGLILASMGSAAAYDKSKDRKTPPDNVSQSEKIPLSYGRGDASRLLEELLTTAGGDYTSFDQLSSNPKSRRSLPPPRSSTGKVNPYGPAIATSVSNRPTPTASHTPPVRNISVGRGNSLSQTYHFPGPLEI
eukprot:TRINITY_DN3097_c0_g1_i3.p1 TRINITY_DN3097_c0_g1~~TRINITY_DN3097_c0_g1_i3.p1  ORF type:complete len:432 (+),score=84.85 TRINITY_DN3097_c0_g1_i3:1122-2417(+)